MRLKITLIIVLFFTLNESIAQQYIVKHFTTKNNLSSNTIHKLDTGNNGLLWISSDNGLCQFNGTLFKTCNVKNGLPENLVLDMCVLNNNNVLFNTYTKGIYLKRKNNYIKPFHFII